MVSWYIILLWVLDADIVCWYMLVIYAEVIFPYQGGGNTNIDISTLLGVVLMPFFDASAPKTLSKYQMKG